MAEARLGFAPKVVPLFVPSQRAVGVAFVVGVGKALAQLGWGSAQLGEPIQGRRDERRRGKDAVGDRVGTLHGEYQWR